jgi:hypothetical protein
MGDWQQAARARLLYGRCRTRPAWRRRGCTAASLTRHQGIAEFDRTPSWFSFPEVLDDLVEGVEEIADSGQVEVTQLDDLVEGVEKIADSGQVDVTQLNDLVEGVEEIADSGQVEVTQLWT